MTIAHLYPDTVLPSLDLPPGSRHQRIWVTDEPLSDSRTYAECVHAFRAGSGLWPVLIPPDERFSAGGQDWLDDRGFTRPDAGQVPDRDPASALAGWWEPRCCTDDCLHPFTSGFPGLAVRSSRRFDPVAEAAETGSLLAGIRDYRLGLVAVDRPGDVLAAVGWLGAGSSTQDVPALSAVLRSWEERYGAMLVVLGFDTLELSVAAPPTTEHRALRLAAEHRAFCLDSFTRQPGTLRDSALHLIAGAVWRFWWD